MLAIARLVAFFPGIAVVLLVPIFWPEFGNGALTAIEKMGSRFAARKRLAIFSIFVLAVILRLGLAVFIPTNPPQVHDEFSYLLASDTFAHGRLANTPHPMSAYFDTFHELESPSYASMYPPGQGAMLALGQRLGSPWIGVVLSSAAMCAAALWMLQGWLPARWALLGSLFVLLRFGLLSYWSNSYWGGNVAAIGGALVLGALPRILRRPRWQDSALAAAGMLILANSRPFEGFVLCAPLVIILSVWLVRPSSPSWRLTLSHVVLPISMILVLGAVFMGYYNWRVTGNPLLLPHSLDDQTHRSTGNFVWDKERPPLKGLNAQFEGYYNHMERTLFSETHNLPVFYWRKITHIGSFFLGRDLLMTPLGDILLLPLFALPFALRDSRIRLLVLEVLVFFAGLLTSVWFEPHYAAPIVVAFVAIFLQAFRHVRRWEWRGHPIGIGLTRSLVLCVMAVVPISTIHAMHYPDDSSSPFTRSRPWAWERQRIISDLERTSDFHLVIVHYSKTHDANHEWVFNRADIDASKVVWAREIPGLDLHPLVNYFHARKIWILEADSVPPRLLPYSE
jgi:hypothetical protein